MKVGRAHFQLYVYTRNMIRSASRLYCTSVCFFFERESSKSSSQRCDRFPSGIGPSAFKVNHIHPEMGGFGFKVSNKETILYFNRKCPNSIETFTFIYFSTYFLNSSISSSDIALIVHLIGENANYHI